MINWLIAARKLDNHGFNVLPADRTKKVPAMWLVGEAKEWKRWQSERTTPYLMKWFREENISREMALCVLTGKISRIVVLDIDSPKAYDAWADRLGRGTLEGTAYARTQSYTKKGGGGVGHYYFRIDPDVHVRSSSQSDEQKEAGILWDLKAEGSHVMVAPTGGYEWIRPPDSILDVPDSLASVANEFKRDPGEKETATGRSTLTALLERLPDTTEGAGRNSLLARVAGHYAKDNRNFKDRFVYHVKEANQKFPDPLPGAEVAKLIESIWSAESAKPGLLADIDNGYLALGTGRDFLYVKKIKDGEEDWIEWANFAPEVLGVMDDEEDVIYDIKLYRKGRRETIRTQISAHTLANANRLDDWLAAHAVGLSDPSAGNPKMPARERLRRYIEHQDAPTFQVAHSLGWHQGSGFLTHDGVIDPKAGLIEFGVHRPDPKLAKWAPYRYGFQEGAVDVLREVLTFHHRQVAAVFGSWWATCFLKPQISQAASLFPFMALEAPSEAGKSTGYFSLMQSLGGNSQGQVVPTAAALRDYVSAHQSGIVWVDDMDNTEHITEILRSATGDGSMAKKGEDNTAQVRVRLVAPIVLSGEHLGLNYQKALQDRAVMVEVPTPTQRKSLSDPTQLQWYDIVALKERHPDLTVFAGSLVQEFLARADWVKRIPEFRSKSGGRFSEKIAIVRMGARMLADVTGLEWIVPEVDAWASGQTDYGDENTLTRLVAPTALQVTSFRDRPDPAHDKWPATPVLLRGSEVLISPHLLGLWWEVYRNGRVNARTETSDALRQQAKALGLSGNESMIKVAQSNDPKRNQRYWKLSIELSRSVLERALQGTDGDGLGIETVGAQLAFEPRIASRPEWISTSDPDEQRAIEEAWKAGQ